MSFQVNIGEIGEQIINEYFKDSKRTDNWYDSEKDGTIGDELYEVKTIRLNHKYFGFLIDQSQYKKVDNVHHLFFVKVPEKISDGIQVYVCENHKNEYQYHHVMTSKGQLLRCYPIRNCKLLFTINDARVKIVYNNSIKLSRHKRYA